MPCKSFLIHIYSVLVSWKTGDISGKFMEKSWNLIPEFGWKPCHGWLIFSMAMAQAKKIAPIFSAGDLRPRIGHYPNSKGLYRTDILASTYCHVPAGWGLRQTTMAQGSDKTRAQGSFSPLTGGLNLT